MDNDEPVMIGPWRRTSSTRVYDNPWIEVLHDEVLTPAGSAGIYGRVNFKNIAVGCIPVDEEGHTWLVRQYRYSLDEASWEIPMGGVPKGADTLAGAKRELEEETGLLAADWQQILRLHTSNSVTDEVGYVFVARRLSEGQQQLEDTEDITVSRLPLSEVWDMVLDGRITDAMSVAGLLRLRLMLESVN